MASRRSGSCLPGTATSSDPGDALRWRLLIDQAPRNGPRNMALDHGLADCLLAGEGVLRLYGWEPPTISFGRNEPAAGRYDRSTAADEGIGFVRRPTGGRAVLHADEVTYSVVFPVRSLGSVRAAYRRIHEGLVTGLRSLGVPASVVEGGQVAGPDAGPCFQMPAPGEVVAGGRKLVGSAQARLGGAMLQHGSVILRGDQGELVRLGRGAGGVEVPPASVEGVLGHPVEVAVVAAALARGLRLALGGRWNEGDYRPTELDRADRLAEERYARDTWTWRR